MNVFRSWKPTRIAILLVAALTVTSLFPILEGLFGITLTSPIFGFEFRYLIGALQAFIFYLVWKWT